MQNGKNQITSAGKQKKRAQRRRNRAEQPGRSLKVQGMSGSFAPTSFNIETRTQAPFISQPQGRQGRDSSTRVRHRELVVASFNRSTNFVVQHTLALNPGLAITFPWLSQIAKNWETYKVHDMVIEYVPIAATGIQGDVIYAPEYDNYDVPPNQETEIAAYEGCVTHSVWAPGALRLNPKAMMGLGPRKFVRLGNTSGDLNTFDAGRVYIGTNNGAEVSPAGKIFISYDIEFFTPQLNTPTNVGLAKNVAEFVVTSAQTVSSNTNIPIATEVVNTLGIVYDAVAKGYRMPAGNYLLTTVLDAIQPSALETFPATATIVQQKNNSAIATNSNSGECTWATAASRPGCVIKNIVNFADNDLFSIKSDKELALDEPLTFRAGLANTIMELL